jgi:choline dehydrogenase-like flavoprotein
MPNDFRTHSTYGVGQDWPISYDDLEPFYTEAEQIMSVAGPTRTPYPKSQPYPLPPHNLNDFDRALRRVWPGQVYSLPSARPSAAVGNRPACCASSICSKCPIDSKFTILNSMSATTRDRRVTFMPNHEVLSLDVEAGRAAGVRGRADGREFLHKADLIVLGSNALFNPAILLRTNPNGLAQVGRGITEQASVNVNVATRGLASFDGSTYQTGHGYMFYDGKHRETQAGALLETNNVPALRNLKDRWRDVGKFKLIFEDFRRDDNRVTVNGDAAPTLTFIGHSKETEQALSTAQELAEKAVERIPFDEISVEEPNNTESHIMCSAPMGDDPATSVVDKYLRHHEMSNVVVAGASAFPTAAPANPTLTLSALSLWSATKLLS